MTKIQKKKIQENIPTIDSLSLWINKKECQIIDSKLTSQTTKIYIDTGEVDHDITPPKPISIESKCKTIRVKAGLKQIAQREYIHITITAKMLKENYFQGITKNNIEQIYKTFIKQKIFICTYETFLNGLANDIDICTNHYLEEYENFKKLINTFKKLVEKKNIINVYKDRKNKEETEKDQEVNTKNIHGIDIGNRNQANFQNPYIKIYFKYIELMSRSKKFKNLYLKNIEITNLMRYEATIKNGKIIKRLANKGIIPKFKTLKELLEIKQDELKKFIEWSHKQYIKKTITTETRNEKTPTENQLTWLIETIIEHEIYNIDEIIKFTQKRQINQNKNTQKQNRNRIKNSYIKIHNEIIKSNEKTRQEIAQNKDIKRVLKQLKIEF